MKKYLALTMAACMALSLAACGSSASSTTSSSAAASTEATSDSAATAEATGSDNITGIAQCCDVGTLDDESFNQGCWEAVKSYGDESGIEYNYYLPSGEDASDEDRETLIRQAVAEGANTIVCVGYLYGPALAWAATEYPDVHFIAVDVNGFDINSENGTIPENVFCVTFKEEEAGYLAGYAAVKDGFTKLGFMGGGGGTNPACCRYGYGFAQGVSAAAKELGITVELKYSWQYGASFSASPELEAMAKGWY
ncbi:MAG TPA: BMP family ABC transporter substrate-binding protein, partial [Ruminococcaceae bacterium]|nr:BMP family ABC transporter substrate-binding protein [Oscillospiraceae bacterium]